MDEVGHFRELIQFHLFGAAQAGSLDAIAADAIDIATDRVFQQQAAVRQARLDFREL